AAAPHPPDVGHERDVGDLARGLPGGRGLRPQPLEHRLRLRGGGVLLHERGGRLPDHGPDAPDVQERAGPRGPKPTPSRPPGPLARGGTRPRGRPRPAALLSPPPPLPPP